MLRFSENQTKTGRAKEIKENTFLTVIHIRSIMADKNSPD
jgi:hypothetical protein